MQVVTQKHVLGFLFGVEGLVKHEVVFEQVRIAVLKDRLLSDPARGTFVTHPAGDLLGGPAGPQTAFDLVAKYGITHQLALPRPAPFE